jgi:hypothetical protein
MKERRECAGARKSGITTAWHWLSYYPPNTVFRSNIIFSQLLGLYLYTQKAKDSTQATTAASPDVTATPISLLLVKIPTEIPAKMHNAVPPRTRNQVPDLLIDSRIKIVHLFPPPIEGEALARNRLLLSTNP